MASEHERRLTEYEAQVDQLQENIKGLEEEVVVLRRRLQDAPKRVRTLEERLLETKGQLAQAVSQNEKLSATLREAREHIAALREEVEKLTMPPSAYGTYLATNDDGTVDIFTAGRKMRVAVHPELETNEPAPGPRGRAERVVERRPRPQLRSRGRDRDVQGAVARPHARDGRRPRRRGARLRARRRAVAREAPRRRPPLDGGPLGSAPREAAPPGGRRARVGGSARRLLRRRRRPRRPDRDDQGRGRAPVPLRRPLQGTRPAAAEGHLVVRPARLWQDAHREGRRQLAGEARRGEDRQHHRPLVLLEHQGSRAA